MRSSVCIDASFVVRALIRGDRSDEVVALIGKWEKQGRSLIAPALFEFEVVSTLRRYVHLKMVSDDTGQEAYSTFRRLGVEIVSNSKVIPLAWKLAEKYNQPRIYDTSYLAVAQLRRCEFWTMDRKLYNAVHKQLDWVSTLSK